MKLTIPLGAGLDFCLVNLFLDNCEHRTRYKMTDVVELEVGVSLGDSSLVSYTYSVMDRKLTLIINTWMEKVLEISFIDPLLFLDEGYISIEYLCENMNKKTSCF